MNIEVNLPEDFGDCGGDYWGLIAWEHKHIIIQQRQVRGEDWRRALIIYEQRSLESQAIHSGDARTKKHKLFSLDQPVCFSDSFA